MADDDIAARWDALAVRALGTCESPAALAEVAGLPESEVEEQLGKRRIEVCEGCGWWFEDHGGPGDPLLCEDCRA